MIVHNNGSGGKSSVHGGIKMAEPFNTTIILKNGDARRFREYDKDPWKNENDRSMAAAERARQLARDLKL